MIANSFSEMCKAVAPSLGNHLWQSTLFAIVAGLLTLLLRNNHARTRYWLWLTASIKFLIPFSLLAGLGSHMAWWRNSAGTNSRVYFAVDQLSQPFSPSHLSLISQVPPSTHPAGFLDLFPTLLAVAWLCGISIVVLAWYVRWRRISAVMRKAAPLREGREVEALRRLERVTGISKQIEMRVSQTTLEPGIFGISEPVLLLPAGISDRLTGEQSDSIITHELCHVRRRDNLVAAVHMLVEGIFWFHPFVWWIGERLVDERERTCDEEVLRLGSDPQVYAESILKVCEFYLESPLFCAAGVTGSNLKKRIEAIMIHRSVRDVELGKKLLLAAMGAAAIVGPLVFGLLDATQSRAQSQAANTSIKPVFAVTSVNPNKTGNDKQSSILFPPNGFTATNVTLQVLIRAAYGVENDRVSGAPSWLDSEYYDVDARVDNSRADEMHQLSEDQIKIERQRLLQALLADRFKLTVHREAKVLPIYALVIAENGPKLQEAKPGDAYANGLKGVDGLPAGPHFMDLRRGGQFEAQAEPVAVLARVLSRVLGSPVLDKTGRAGDYDFTLKWIPDASLAPTYKGTNSSESSGPSIFTALQEQLGLKLVTEQGPVEILVIDRAEKPQGN